jgi:hypothetical protein
MHAAPSSDHGWIPLDDGAALALREGRLVARNKKGKPLKSVSKKLKESPQGEQLQDVAKLLREHTLECLETVERWMLRSLPVPREVIVAVWPDACWQRLLLDTVIVPDADTDSAGFLKEVDAERGLGIVDLDGESRWVRPTTLAVPHPILLQERADFRELAAELGIEQQLGQLMRETFALPTTGGDRESVVDYAGATFEMVRQAAARARAIGCRMSGGYAVTTVWEDARLHQASFWLGDDPDDAAETGELTFSCDGAALRLSEVPPVTYSEGMRMASLIHAARQIEEQQAQA